MNHYVIGSTRDDGWYLKGYRVIDETIAYSQWVNSRNQAARFTDSQRHRLTLPQAGCWVLINYAPASDGFEVSREADEVPES